MDIPFDTSKMAFTNYVDKAKYVLRYCDTGNVNGMQIFSKNSYGIPSLMSSR